MPHMIKAASFQKENIIYQFQQQQALVFIHMSQIIYYMLYSDSSWSVSSPSSSIKLIIYYHVPSPSMIRETLVHHLNQNHLLSPAFLANYRNPHNHFSQMNCFFSPLVLSALAQWCLFIHIHNFFSSDEI